MKKTVGFRFSEETLRLLAELSERWGCTRTSVIEQLVEGSSHELDEPIKHEAVHKAPEMTEKGKLAKPQVSLRDAPFLGKR